MVGDREPVRLVAQALDEVQGARRRRQQDRVARAGQEQLLALLGQPDERQVVQAELVEDGLGRRDLALPAVDDHEVRELPAQLLGAALVAGLRPAEAAQEHLLVAGEVVRALDRADPEAAVVPGPRPALLEDDHAADRLGALERADVVALDAHRRTRQVERRRELLERSERAALIGQPAGLLAGQGLGGVADRQLHELALLAAPRDPQVHRPGAPLGQERLERGDR